MSLSVVSKCKHSKHIKAYDSQLVLTVATQVCCNVTRQSSDIYSILQEIFTKIWKHTEMSATWQQLWTISTTSKHCILSTAAWRSYHKKFEICQLFTKIFSNTHSQRVIACTSKIHSHTHYSSSKSLTLMEETVKYMKNCNETKLANKDIWCMPLSGQYFPIINAA